MSDNDQRADYIIEPDVRGDWVYHRANPELRAWFADFHAAQVWIAHHEALLVRAEQAERERDELRNK